MIPFINISEVEKHFDQLVKYPELRKAIKGFRRAASTADDLFSARDALDTMDTLQDDRDRLKLFGKALMTHAITLYSRATHSEAKGRGGHIGADKGYSPEQRKTHIALIALRNEIIAHAGVANHILSKAWRIEAAHVVEEHDGFSIGFISMHAMDNVVLRQRFRDVLDQSIRTAVEKRNVARDTLSEAWNQYAFEPELRALLGNFVDTYENFYGVSEEEAIEMWNNPRYKDPT